MLNGRQTRKPKIAPHTNTRFLQIAYDNLPSLSAEHPIRGVVLGRLGEALAYTGKLKLAAQCYAAAVIQRAKSLGEEHPTTTTTRANLACVLLLGGQAADGVTLLSACVDQLQAALGSHHQRSTVMAANLGKAKKHAALLSQDYGGLGRRPSGLGLRSTSEVSHLLTDAKWKADLRPAAVDPFKRVKPKKGRR